VNWRGGVRRRLRAVVDRLTVTVHPRPVILLGTEKSGTSAITHLLADRCSLTKTVDIPELWPPFVVDVMRGAVPFADVVRRTPRPFAAAIIKENTLVYFFDQVAARFPDARFAFIARDPRDTVRSVLNRLSVPGNLEDFDPLAWSIPVSWQAVLEPVHWGLPGSSHYIDVLAERWKIAAQVYLDHRQRMALVRYEDFVADKQGTVDELARRLGLTPAAPISSGLDVQYQPRGRDRATPWPTFFGAANLRRIEERCGPVMKQLGY
jgi:hypothetical protein